MRRFFLRIHLWLSIPFGMLLSVICLTGALLVFEDEASHLLSPVPAVVQAEDMHVATAAGAGGVGVEAVTAPQQPKPERSAFFVEVRKLHRWLLDPPASKGESSIGRIIVGCSTLAMVLILISGLIIWIPRSHKALRNRLTIARDKGPARFWHDVHTALGIYALVFLLLSALIGPTWSFGWYRDIAVGLFGGDPTMRRIFLDLHTGSWGGIFSKLLQFAAGLIGAVLPLTGYYMWWRRTHPLKRKG